MNTGRSTRRIQRILYLIRRFPGGRLVLFVQPTRRRVRRRLGIA